MITDLCGSRVLLPSSPTRVRQAANVAEVKRRAEDHVSTDLFLDNRPTLLHTSHMPDAFNIQLDALLTIIDDAVDASTDVLRADVLCMPRGPFFSSAVVDAAIAEYAAHGWRVSYGRKAGTWLRLERDSLASA